MNNQLIKNLTQYERKHITIIKSYMGSGVVFYNKKYDPLSQKNSALDILKNIHYTKKFINTKNNNIYLLV